jgi:Putative zinc-finger
MMPGRHNDPLDPHERARTLASDRLGEALAPADASWLEEHLGGCEDCRTRADAYAANRELLRGLPAPEPPRDLWVRTTAALDRERRRRARAGRAGSARAGSNRVLRRPAPARWETLAGIAAVLVVGLFVVQAIRPSNVVAPQAALASGAPSVPDASILPAATPMTVLPADVAWVSRAPDGRYKVNLASVASVCPQDAAPDCAPFDAAARQVISLDRQPGAIVFAPTRGQAAIVEAAATQFGGSILVVPFAREAPSPGVSPSDLPSVQPSLAPSDLPNPAQTAPAVSVEPPTPVAPPTPVEPPPAVPSPQPTTEPSTVPSPQPPASVEPSPLAPVPGETAVATLGALESPTPTLSTAVPIISGIVVVGGDLAYSPDGAWLAFSARSANGTDGPDVYVWHVGDVAARRLTADHATVFSSWVGDQILASRAVLAPPAGLPSPAPSSPTSLDASTPSSPEPSPTAQEVVPSSVSIDPLTGIERPLGGNVGWRPVVDPTGRWVAYWTGTLRYDPGVSAWVPDAGRLVIDSWLAAVPDGTSYFPTPSAVAAPSAVAPVVPTSTPDPLLTPTPIPTADPQPLLDPRPGETIRDWTVHWDPTGTYVAAWVGDPLVAGLGRISLIPIDQTTGRPTPEAVPLLRDAPALAGFAIGDGRLAWATPSGQDGDGSRLEVLAWRGADAGKARTEPAPPQENIVVVN